MEKRGICLKAQASTEILIVLAVALAVFIGIFTYTQESASTVATDFEVTKARSAIDTLANAIDLTYQQGYGAKSTIYVNYPRSIKSTLVSNQTITLILYGPQGDITLYRNFDFNINGSIEYSQGGNWVTVQSLGTSVEISNVSAISVPSAYCGNSIVEGTEQCDSSIIDQTCITLGYTSGTLYCTSSCAFNVSNCVSSTYVCGNNVTDLGEICDGTNLTGETCASQGYAFGKLSCLSNCSNYNYNNCRPYWRIDLWPYAPDEGDPVSFDSGLNSTANTFWPPPTGTNDGWDWKSDVYSGYSSCVSFNNADVVNDKRLEMYTGYFESQCTAAGSASAAYGIQFYVDSDVYDSITLGHDANLSFIWSFNETGLDASDDAWIKATIGNGTTIAFENWESREFSGSNTNAINFQGGFGWLYEWFRSGTYAVSTDRPYGGAYSFRLTSAGYIDRAVNLSKYTNPVIRFYANARSLEVGDIAYFLVSPDDINYTTIYQWTVPHSTGTYQYFEFPLAKNTTLSGEYWVAFQLAAGANDFFYVDEIDIVEGTVNYLGTNQDVGSSFGDPTNEIMWFNNPADSFNNHVLLNATPHITAPGWYYLTLGVKNHQWGANERAETYFDNVSIIVQR